MAISNLTSKIKSKRKQANQSDFEIVWPGVKRCLDCGYCVAQSTIHDSDSDVLKAEKREGNRKENSAHSTYHGKFYKAQRQYGESNVFLYRDLREKSAEIFQRLLSLKSNDISDDLEDVTLFIQTLKDFLVEFEKWLNSIDARKSKYLKEEVEFLKEEVESLKKKVEGVKKSRILYEKDKGTKVFMTLAEMLKQFQTISNKIDMMRQTKRSKYDEGYTALEFPNFLNDIDFYIDKLNHYIITIPTKNNKAQSVLNDYFRIEYTKSLRLWDMCKLHPPFEDYCSLLWNTPKFQNFIRGFLTDKQYINYVNANLANRRLVDYHFDEAPFYFGAVEETGLRVSSRVKDFSYMDKLILAGEIDDGSDNDDIEDIEDIKNIESTEKTMAQLGKLLYKR